MRELKNPTKIIFVKKNQTKPISRRKNLKFTLQKSRE